jgi:proteasome lid subunit RPN8/RPN11
VKIKRVVVDSFLEVCKNTYPNEFGGLLRGKDEIVTDILLLPGTINAQHFTQIKMNMLPINSDVVGSAHSHPSYSNQPSRGDLQFFGKFGNIHLIASLPFTINDLAAYNCQGQKIDFEIIEGDY